VKLSSIFLRKMVLFFSHIAKVEGTLIRIKDIEPAPLAQVINFVNRRLPHEEVHEFAEFLEPIFNLDPEKRPRASDLLNHHWLNKEVIEKPNRPWWWFGRR
jgi:serine/threonine protein kinase